MGVLLGGGIFFSTSTGLNVLSFYANSWSPFRHKLLVISRVRSYPVIYLPVHFLKVPVLQIEKSRPIYPSHMSLAIPLNAGNMTTFMAAHPFVYYRPLPSTFDRWFEVRVLLNFSFIASTALKVWFCWIHLYVPYRSPCISALWN